MKKLLLFLCLIIVPVIVPVIVPAAWGAPLPEPEPNPAPIPLPLFDPIAPVLPIPAPQISGSTVIVQYVSAGDRINVSAATPLPVTCISGCGGGGPGSDVNISEYGGVAVGPANPFDVQGTVDVGNFPLTFGVTQSTSPWVVSADGGAFSVTQGTSPWVVSGTVTANAGTGNFTVVQSTGTNLHMVCDSGCTPGGSFADDSAFTEGMTAINVVGGEYNTMAGNCTDGNACAPQLTIDRKLYVQSFQGTSPWVVSADGGSFDVNVTNANIEVTQGTSPWTVDGTVNVGNFPATQDVNVTNASLAVTGPLTDAELRATPVPISGTVTVTDGAGALNVIVDSGTITTITNPVTVTDGSGALNVIVDSGTVTANQGTSPWIVAGGGTAGSAATGVVTVQGIASMTPVQVSQATASNLNATVVGTGTFAVQATLAAETTKVIGTVRNLGNAGATVDAVVGAGTAPTNMWAVGGLYNSTEISPTTGQSAALQLDSKGRLRNVIMDAAGNTRGANVDASNRLSVSVDAFTATNASTNVAQMNGVAVTMGNGASGTGVQRVTIASDSTGQVALTDGSEVAPVATASTTDSGLGCYIVSAASTNSNSCKGSAGNLYGYEIFNTTTTVYYLRLYNSSGAPTCSSATGFIRSIPIPPAAASGQTGGAVSYPAVALGYSTGIGYCITGGSSSTDNTNAAVGIFGQILYK